MREHRSGDLYVQFFYAPEGMFYCVRNFGHVVETRLRRDEVLLGVHEGMGRELDELDSIS